jgi:hypothetical protein
MNNRRANRREFLSMATAAALDAKSIGRALTARGDSGGRHYGTLIPLTTNLRATPATSSPEGAPIHGIMADAARTPEKFEYYERLIDFCTEWGLNAIQLRLTDDEGCALRFESHPELVTHRNAFSKKEMGKLVDYGVEHGVNLIPEIESFGHTTYITGVPKYAELSDRGANGAPQDTGIIPLHPKTLAIFRDLYSEIASIFPSHFIHGGCDEVNWGGSEFSQHALQSKTRTQIWAEYLNFLDVIARGLGKELIVWGDRVLRGHYQPAREASANGEPEILALLNKSVIVMDYNYEEPDPVYVRKLAQKAIDSGHRVMGAPAWGYCRWGPRAGTVQLRNIDAYADGHRGLSGSLGVIVTNWNPSRYLPDAIWDGFAYAAVALNESSTAARNTAFRRFVETHYAAQWTPLWEDVFRTIYDTAPYSPDCCSPWMTPRLIAPWHNDQELTSTLKLGSSDFPPYTRLRSQLLFCQGTVRKNLDDFSSFQLCADYLEHLFWRATSVVEEAQRKDGSKGSASLLIHTVAERDRQLLERLDADWDRERPGNAEDKFRALPGSPSRDQLLFRFREASTFSAQLAEDPERFYGLLEKALLRHGNEALKLPQYGNE